MDTMTHVHVIKMDSFEAEEHDYEAAHVSILDFRNSPVPEGINRENISDFSLEVRGEYGYVVSLSEEVMECVADFYINELGGIV